MKNKMIQVIHNREFLDPQIYKQQILGIKTLIHTRVLNYKPRLYIKLGLNKNFDVVFAAGNQGIKRYEKKSEIIAVNHFDYDNFLATRNYSDQLIQGKYCVFLDEFLPFHPDFKMLNIKTVEPKEYFQSLNLFFSKIEEKYGFRVIIAAHPKSGSSYNEFGNRPCIKYKTNELVKNCEFVLAHFSTAVSFAILFQKPVLFIYTNGMEQIYRNSYIPFMRNFSFVLGSNPINVDQVKETKDIVISGVDLKKYNLYKYNYLTSKKSENLSTKDILLKYLKSSI